jgi:hypothetical protein
MPSDSTALFTALNKEGSPVKVSSAFKNLGPAPVLTEDELSEGVEPPVVTGLEGKPTDFTEREKSEHETSPDLDDLLDEVLGEITIPAKPPTAEKSAENLTIPTSPQTKGDTAEKTTETALPPVLGKLDRDKVAAAIAAMIAEKTTDAALDDTESFARMLDDAEILDAISEPSPMPDDELLESVLAELEAAKPSTAKQYADDDFIELLSSDDDLSFEIFTSEEEAEEEPTKESTVIPPAINKSASTGPSAPIQQNVTPAETANTEEISASDGTSTNKLILLLVGVFLILVAFGLGVYFTDASGNFSFPSKQTSSNIDIV